MTPPVSPLFIALSSAGDAIADAVNPALTIVMIVVIVQEFRRRVSDGFFCLLAAALGLGSIYAIGALEAAPWRPLGMDYSTHTAYASSLIISILAWRRAWAKVLVAAGLGYFILIVVMRYHHVGEVIVASVAAVIATIAWQALARRLGTRYGAAAR